MRISPSRFRPRNRLSQRSRLSPRSRLARAAGALLVAGVPLLAACGGSSGGPVTITWYTFPDSSGAFDTAAANCTAQSNGAYKVNYVQLPNDANGQRQQLVRRLAAKFSDVDVMGLDVTWEAEFAEAGWILPWTGTYEAQARADTLAAPLQTAIWKNQLYAVPANSNTQLLWYRSDLTPTPPATWAEMISDAQKLAAEGKPHLIEIQGAQYEGVVVWFNTLVASAGGQILNADATSADIGPATSTALGVMRDLVRSGSSDPSLSVQKEDQNRLAMESGKAAFEINYPYVYPSMKTDQPALFKVFKWAPYPRVDAATPAKVTIGGNDLAISKYSKHPDLAFQAALCLRDKANQQVGAIKGGLPPTIGSLYDSPALQADYPFRALIQQQIADGAVRPKTPAYQSVSITISNEVSPPGSGSPASVSSGLSKQINQALQSKGLIP